MNLDTRGFIKPRRDKCHAVDEMDEGRHLNRDPGEGYMSLSPTDAPLSHAPNYALLLSAFFHHIRQGLSL